MRSVPTPSLSRYRGDFAFLLPIVGCVKGCGSSNTCPMCNAWCTKEGGTKHQWVDMEKASLRTLRDQFTNYFVAKTLLSQADLQANWRETLHHLRSLINLLNTSYGLPVAPKLHILTVHIEQWVDLFGRSLGLKGELGSEAVHHIWLRLLEKIGKPKKKEGPFYLNFMLKVLLIFNSNNM